MQRIPKEDIDKLINKYTKRLEKNIKKDVESSKKNSDFSKEYLTFREELISKRSSRYEKYAKFAGRIINVKPNEKILPQIKESLEISHLNLTPKDVASFGVFYPMFIGIIALLGSIAAYIFDLLSLAFFLSAIFLISILMINVLSKIPINIASSWRIKAGDQIVLTVLYIVIYMRHTSNLENAIKFASDHIGGPISLDLKKIFWDVEVGKYSTIKESLDNYLLLWRNHNLSFVNSIHLIESSLYEPSEERRLILLDKSLQVVLDGVYNNMLRYARELINPITILHMLGVILPILGLVIFPLIGAFLGGDVKWYHLAILYNVLLPILVYNLGMNILSKRPSGYSENILGYGEYKGNKFIPGLIIFIFLIIGISPFIMLYANLDINRQFLGQPFLDFDIQGDKTYGPYGYGALFLGIFIPLGLALGLGSYYSFKTRGLLKKRNETKDLEKEFSSSLFQFGNRVGDGIPSEKAFKDVAETMQGTPTGGLFFRIHNNLSKLGMGLREAIFDREKGALKDYPSPLVESSMEVLVESAKKGPTIVSQSLISISNYVNSVNAVAERLKDLLADISSSMQSQIRFMAPVIAGIVVGISSMIVGVIAQLGNLIDQAQSEQALGGNLVGLAGFFNINETIPSYFFQITVGVYVIQIVYILSILANGIENGSDKLNEQYSLGKNLIRSGILYVIISAIVIILFNLLTSHVLGSVTE